VFNRIIGGTSMDKYILANIVTERLTRELGMVPKTLPEEIRILETTLPIGKVRTEPALYQAAKLKKIVISRRSQGEDLAGTLVMLISEDEYDFPFTLADITFNFAGKGKMFVAFQFRPLVNDDISTRQYVEPLRKWFEAINEIPSEPVIPPKEPGEFLKNNPAPIRYIRIVQEDYIEEVLNLAQQFFNIVLDIYRKAEPIKDTKRRKEMDTFRSEWNKHIFSDDPSSQSLAGAYGQKTAALFCENLVYL
jgi:hypothetical protein